MKVNFAMDKVIRMFIFNLSQKRSYHENDVFDPCLTTS